MKPRNLLLLVASLSGCVSHVPILVQVPRCVPDMSMSPCASPVPLKEGSTYAELLAHYQTDRQSLQSCALDQEYLRKALATCNSIIDEYNQKARSKQGADTPSGDESPQVHKP